MTADPLDRLLSAWDEASHNDDWNVGVVYRPTFLRLVATELDRMADELNEIRRSMQDNDLRTIRSAALGKGVKRLRDRAKAIRAFAREGV